MNDLGLLYIFIYLKNIMKVIYSRYEVFEILGQGGVGITYKAKDLQTNQFIAIKVISFR
jgi:eukaryotic-like serine/threonine-protein kinase